MTAALAITHFSKERKDIKVDIYEAASEFAEIGAGLAFYARPKTVMKVLGVADDLKALVAKPAGESPARMFMFILITYLLVK